MEKERDVAAQFTAELGEDIGLQAELPELVQTEQRRRSVGRSAGEPGLHGNALDEADPAAAVAAGVLLQQMGEREIIKLRYGLGDGYTYTLEEVGRIFKVTRERVRQIEAKAVRKLQHPVRSRQLEGFLDGIRNRQ